MNLIKAIKNYGMVYCIDAFLVKTRIKKELSFKSKLTIQKYLKSLPNDLYPKMLQERFKNITGLTLNLDNPQSFNEKIQWLKLFDSTSLKTLYADKYQVRKVIGEKIGEKYLIPIIGGAWQNAKNIDFSELPQQFVLKCNHGSGMNIIVKDKSKIDKEKIIRQLNRWLKIDYAFFWQFCDLELHYSSIPPVIYAEKYIQEIDGNLHDYKIHCFNGKPIYIEVISDRDYTSHQALESWYDTNWQKQQFTDGVYPNNPQDIKRPRCLDEMLTISNILSSEFKYARIDLYEVNGQVLFGEITFTPGSGTYKWNPQEANQILGQHIII